MLGPLNGPFGPLLESQSVRGRGWSERLGAHPWPRQLEDGGGEGEGLSEEVWPWAEEGVASRVATGKSGLHGRGEGERVIALKSG